MIKDGETIIRGSGTTVLEIAKNIKHIKNLTVFTNSLPVLSKLLITDMKIFYTGGQLRLLDLCMSVGRHSENFYKDKTFISALSITPKI